MKKKIACCWAALCLLTLGLNAQESVDHSSVEHTSLEHTSGDIHPIAPPDAPAVYPFEENLDSPISTDDHFIKGFMSMLASLGIIIALLLIVSWFFKKMMNTRLQQLNTTSDIKILERRSLSPKATIYLLEIKGKGIVIAESSNGLTRLADFNPDDGQEQSSSFENLIQK